MTAQLPLLGADSWLQQAMTSPLGVRCLWIGLACVLGIVVVGGMVVRMGRGRSSTRVGRSRGWEAPGLLGLGRDNSGTAMIEFVLVAPLLLFMGLLLAQTAMVMSGNMYVHYAGFAATRSAIVQIPADYGLGEQRNEYGTQKHEKIRQAAVMAVLPAAGRGSASGGFGNSAGSGAQAGAALSQGLDAHYGAYGASPPNWVDRQADARLSYANGATRVVVVETIVRDAVTMEFNDLPEGGPYVFGPKDPISVRVEHQLALSVPVARRVFADAGEDWTLVTARYTLTNEGIPTELPEAPAIPRQ